jgi:hypothetical protein
MAERAWSVAVCYRDASAECHMSLHGVRWPGEGCKE